MKPFEYKVWCEPIFRGGKLILVKGDVTEAIKHYQEETGHLPLKIALAPENQYHTEEIPEGIEVELKTGICSWEIWLADGLKKLEVYPPEGKIDPGETLEIPPTLSRTQKLGHETVGAVNSTTRIMKQPVIYSENDKVSKITGRRGRPVVFGATSRTTLWRRKKAQAQMERLL